MYGWKIGRALSLVYAVCKLSGMIPVLENLVEGATRVSGNSDEDEGGLGTIWEVTRVFKDPAIGIVNSRIFSVFRFWLK